jgi:hypothetical protein
VRTAASAANSAIATLVSAKTSDQRSSGGIAVYLPTSSTDIYLSSYATDAAAFCQATGWQTFAKWLATGTRSAGTATVATTARRHTYRTDVRGSSSSGAEAAWAAFASGGIDASGSKPTRSRGRISA